MADVVVFEPQLVLFTLRHGVVLCLEGLGVDFRTGAKVLLGVCEEDMGACAGNVRPTELGVGKRDFGGLRCDGCAHQLLEQLPLFSGHGRGEWLSVCAVDRELARWAIL